MLWEARGGAFITHDGGHQWQPISIVKPESIEGIDGAMLSDQSGYLLLRNVSQNSYSLLRTQSDGETWATVKTWMP